MKRFTLGYSALLISALLLSGCAQFDSGVASSAETKDPSRPALAGSISSREQQLLLFQELGLISASIPHIVTPVEVTTRWAGVVDWTVQNDPQIPNDLDFPYLNGKVELGYGRDQSPLGEINVSVKQPPDRRILVECVVSTPHLKAQVYDYVGNQIDVSPLIVPYDDQNGETNTSGWFLVTVLTPPTSWNGTDPNPRDYTAVRIMASTSHISENWNLRQCKVWAFQ